MRRSVVRTLAPLAFALPALLPAQQQTPPPTAPPNAAPGQAGQPPARRGPRPYAQVITDKAVTDAGGITVHRVDERWFFEVPDSLAGRDLLFVTRIAGS